MCVNHFATHFHNFYQDALLEEVQRYIGISPYGASTR
jgi:hypothetical protein